MKIEELKNRANRLDRVCDEVYEITGQSRHLTVNHILVDLMRLADDNDINIDVELENVRHSMNKLQSSIFEIHNTFKDELKWTNTQIELKEIWNDKGVA
tara:strand:- start:176 stop:472 length:297 start_codon:yes stop_codon:yes gene_type:complete